MKTQKQHTKNKKPLHLHVEHFLRTPILLGVVLGMLLIAIIKADSKLLGMVHEAYGEGYGVVGAYMRKEVVHAPHAISTFRIPTISGQ